MEIASEQSADWRLEMVIKYNLILIIRIPRQINYTLIRKDDMHVKLC